MIQITLSFNTLDEAIVFLGKQHAVGKVRKAADTDANPAVEAGREVGRAGAVGGGAAVTDASGTASTPAASTVAPKRKRKPRADAGKKRGSYKNVEAPEKTDAVPPPTPPEAPAASTPETAAPTTEPEQRDPPPSGASDAAAPKEDELIAAGDALLNAKGLPAVMELMQSFGVNRLRDLPEDKRAEFIAKATA